MVKIKKQSFSEDVGLYYAEEKYLNQEPNEALYYINGKIIVRSDSGEYFFAPLSEESKEFFVFGSQVENENLLPVAQLDAKDLELMYQLNSLNEDINQYGIYAVSKEAQKAKDKEVYYSVISHIGHSENTYFRILIPELQNLNKAQIDELLDYDEERNLSNPYHVQIEDSMLLAY